MQLTYYLVLGALLTPGCIDPRGQEDAGPLDAARALDSGAALDATPASDGGAILDAAPGLDGGSIDAGYDSGPPLPGVTCIVDERPSAGCTLTTSAYENVPFAFDFSTFPFEDGITSPLNPLIDLYGHRRFSALDPAQSTYSLYPPEAEVDIVRRDRVLNVSFDRTRQGLPGCATARIRVRCSGSTLVEPYDCASFQYSLRAFDLLPPLACTVTRRDAQCVAGPSTSTDVPRFWLSDGIHGVDSEIHADWGTVPEETGVVDPVTVFYGNVCRNRYGGHSIARTEDRIAVQQFGAASAETCIDSLGYPQRIATVGCSGASVLVGHP
jgi:hypothetical protein